MTGKSRKVVFSYDEKTNHEKLVIDRKTVFDSYRMTSGDWLEILEKYFGAEVSEEEYLASEDDE